MTIAALTNALTGLQASQRALAIVSNNVANANTEGYTKKVAQFESLNFGRSSGGVKIGDIARNVDEFLLRDRRKALGELRQVEVAKEFTETVEKLFGTLKEAQSVSALVNTFGTALEDLSTSPEDVFNHKRVVDRGQDLIEKLNFINERLQDLRVQADQEIAADITEINIILEQIDEYNVQIARAKAVDPEGGIDENLRDKRDVQLNKLSELIDISYFEDANGTVSISTTSGHTLLSVDPVTLYHSAAVAIDKGIRYDPDEIPLTTNDGAIDGIFVGIGRTETDDITSLLLRGRIKGLVEVRDTILPNLQDQIDSLAETMQVEVNRIHNLNSAFPPASELGGTRIFGSYNAVDNSIDVTAAGTQLLAATGHVRISVVTRTPASAAGETVSTLSIDLDALRARDYSAVVDANTGLTGSAAGQLTVADLAIYINNALGQNGAAFPASLGIDGDGNVTLTAANPTTQGVMVHSADQLYRSQEITGPASLNALLGTQLGVASSFYVVDGDTGASLNGDTALTFAANATYEDVIKAINQIDGVTAGFVHDPGPNGVAGGGDDRFYLEITADDGGTLRFVDTAGTLMTGAATGGYNLPNFSLTNNSETFAFRGDGTTAISAAFPLAATATTFTVYHPTTGEVLGTANVDPTGADTIADMVTALNAIPGVFAVQEEVFTDPAAAAPNNVYSVVRINGSNGEALRVTEAGGGDVGQDSGLLTTLGSEATAATVTNAQSKAFPVANKTLDRFDGSDTAATPLTMTITYPHGSTQTITIDPATQTLADIATAINALGAVNGPGGANSITLGARIINDNGRKLEVFVQQAAADQSFTGALGFSGTLATTLAMDTGDSTNFSHYLGLNDFFVDGNEDSLSQTLAVRPDIEADENLLAWGRARNSVMSFTDTGGLTRNTVAIASGNNQGALSLARVFQTNLTFAAVGSGTEKFALPSLNGTLSEYGSRIVSNTGLETRIIEDEAEFRATVDSELAFRIEGIQGVNLDEEMSDLILFQNAYQASARVISVSQEIMDELIGLVR